MRRAARVTGAAHPAGAKVPPTVHPTGAAPTRPLRPARPAQPFGGMEASMRPS